MRIAHTSAVAALLLLTVVGCKGNSSTTPTSPTPPPVATPAPPPTAPSPPPPLTATITIGSNNRFIPSEVTVAVGGRVTFVNQNNRPYDITSDPPQLHTDCPAVMDVGFISPDKPSKQVCSRSPGAAVSTIISRKTTPMSGATSSFNNYGGRS